MGSEGSGVRGEGLRTSGPEHRRRPPPGRRDPFSEEDFVKQLLYKISSLSIYLSLMGGPQPVPRRLHEKKAPAVLVQIPNRGLVYKGSDTSFK